VVLCYLHSIALSEALMLGVKAGVSAPEMLDIIQSSTGRSYVADRYGPCMLNGDYDPSFALGLALKDMKLAMELADTLAIDLPMSSLVTMLYTQACDQYGTDSNHLIAVRMLEEARDTYFSQSA
jgi:3-hydroxyisobutyrate dehydrogenase-like beta-hydroxyacid dehydrogenase